MSLRSSLPALALATLTACGPSEQELREHQNRVNDVTREYNQQKGLDLCAKSAVGLFYKVATEDIGTAKFANQARSAMYYATMPGGADYQAKYTASSSPLLGIDSLPAWRAESYDLKSYESYNFTTPDWVAGLPQSLEGKEVKISSKIPTNAYPYAIHLGADDTEDGPDHYKVTSGRAKLKNGVEADTVTINGPMDYCYNTDSQRQGMNANHRACNEKLGQLIVTIKPPDFDSRCADLKLQLQQAIEAIQ